MSRWSESGGQTNLQDGGGTATSHGGVIYFSNVTDGRVYKLEQGKQPEAVTPGARYVPCPR